MRVLIVTSSGGTAHDAAAYAIRDWLQLRVPPEEAVQVEVQHVLEDSSPIIRFCVNLYNWIQTYAPWLHQVYWRLIEWEDVVKPGTVLVGRRYLIRLLLRFQPDLLISTHPHINRGHFDLAKRVLGPQLRCVTCCTELEGGFGFTRNWVSRKADVFWALTPEVAKAVGRRRYPAERISVLGPLLYPAFHADPGGMARPSLRAAELPLLVLGSGANGANNHRRLLEQLLPFAGRVEVVALCGRRQEALEALQQWRVQHPSLALRPLGFQGPEAMAALYRQAWALVSRPGARTATEALMLGCPLIFNHFGLTMPQELLAVRYFRARGLEVSIRRPRDLAGVVARWLEAPESHAALRRRYRQAQLPSDPSAPLAMLLGP